MDMRPETTDVVGQREKWQEAKGRCEEGERRGAKSVKVVNKGGSFGLMLLFWARPVSLFKAQNSVQYVLPSSN